MLCHIRNMQWLLLISLIQLLVRSIKLCAEKLVWHPASYIKIFPGRIWLLSVWTPLSKCALLTKIGSLPWNGADANQPNTSCNRKMHGRKSHIWLVNNGEVNFQGDQSVLWTTTVITKSIEAKHHCCREKCWLLLPSSLFSYYVKPTTFQDTCPREPSYTLE